jgi:hypothetical protein
VSNTISTLESQTVPRRGSGALEDTSKDLVVDEVLESSKSEILVGCSRLSVPGVFDLEEGLDRQCISESRLIRQA